MGITPHHRSYTPIRHPLAVNPLPGFAGYRVYPSPELSLRGQDGLLQLLSVSLPTCRRYYPAKVIDRFSQNAINHTAFTLRMGVQPLELRTFEVTYAFTFVTACSLTPSLTEELSIGFRILVSRHPAIQVTRPLTLTPAGLVSC